MRLSAIEPTPQSPGDRIVTLWAQVTVESSKRGVLHAEWSKVWYQAPVGHGTQAGYSSGCRCDQCRLSHSIYGRAYRQRKAM